MHALERAAAELTAPALGGEADWLGRLDKTMRHLRGLRAGVIAELDGPVEGEEYRVVASNRAERSYNTAALVELFDEADISLHDLVRSDVVRLGWRWTELRRALQAAGLPVIVASREVSDVGDLDELPIGEVWKTDYRVEAR